MVCPNKHRELEKILFHNVEVDYCPACLGIFFDKEELNYAVDDKDKQLNWLDIDLWRDKEKFQIFPVGRTCPICKITLAQVSYDNSSVKIDLCKMCGGIWLDRGEFKQLINYLKEKADYEVLHHYTKNLIQQLWEVFSGPKALRQELSDFLMILKLLNYKFLVQHPHLEKMIEKMPK